MPKPANKQTIAVDIDDVISAQNERMRLYANEKYGHNHTPEDYLKEAPYWGYWGYIWGVDDYEQELRVQHYNNSGQLGKQDIVHGAPEALASLKKRYGIVIVTSRHDKHADETHKWLNEHYKNLFDDVKFARVWGGNEQKTKAAICKEVGAGYLIDDNAEHCNLAAESGITALLFGDYGWNRGAGVHEDVIRVKGWEQVLEYFNV